MYELVSESPHSFENKGPKRETVPVKASMWGRSLSSWKAIQRARSYWSGVCGWGVTHTTIVIRQAAANT